MLAIGSPATALRVATGDRRSPGSRTTKPSYDRLFSRVCCLMAQQGSLCSCCVLHCHAAQVRCTEDTAKSTRQHTGAFSHAYTDLRHPFVLLKAALPETVVTKHDSAHRPRNQAIDRGQWRSTTVCVCVLPPSRLQFHKAVAARPGQQVERWFFERHCRLATQLY
jgi:hypothetical protein